MSVFITIIINPLVPALPAETLSGHRERFERQYLAYVSIAY